MPSQGQMPLHCQAHLGVGKQNGMLGAGTRISVNNGRYPGGSFGAVLSSKSSTVPRISLETSPLTSSKTSTCSSLEERGNEDIKRANDENDSPRFFAIGLFIFCNRPFNLVPCTLLDSYLISGYFATSPETSRDSMLGSLSWIKSASTFSSTMWFTSLSVPSASCRRSPQTQ